MSLSFTPDNTSLSDPKMGWQEGDLRDHGEGPTSIAINCKTTLTGSVADYVQVSRASSTLRAYASDLEQFRLWGGFIPSTPEQVADYIASQADRLKPATLARHLASITVAHKAKGLTSPVESELVRSVFRGIRRVKGVAQAAAKPMLKEDLFAVLDSMGDKLRDIRDRSLLLVGFAGGFRRSELVGLNIEDLQFVRQGMVIILRQSKIDQDGWGRKIGIPFGRTRHCPVRVTETWLELSSISTGPIYRPIIKGGQVSLYRLSDAAVPDIIRERLKNAGVDPHGYGGHSLRSGFATSAAMAGVAAWRIRKQTGHASDAMLSRYIRDGELFEGNAAGAIL